MRRQGDAGKVIHLGEAVFLKFPQRMLERLRTAVIAGQVLYLDGMRGVFTQQLVGPRAPKRKEILTVHMASCPLHDTARKAQGQEKA